MLASGEMNVRDERLTCQCRRQSMVKFRYEGSFLCGSSLSDEDERRMWMVDGDGRVKVRWGGWMERGGGYKGLGQANGTLESSP